VYPASYPPPPLDAYAGGAGRAIHKVMGAQTQPLEHFLVKRKLMGPQWVRLKSPKLDGTAASWCKIEVVKKD
jgi:DNA polymerase alpha subunit A